MEKSKRKKFVPDVCPHCTQTTNYDLALDRGSALIVLAVYNAVRRLDRNRIHVGNEMVRPATDFPSYRDMVAGGWMTFKMEGNMSRPGRHGLITKATDTGEWLITPKGARFLRGEAVPRVAIVDKTTGHKAYYLNEDTDRVTFSDLMKREVPFWDVSRNDRIDFLLGIGDNRHMDRLPL